MFSSLRYALARIRGSFHRTTPDHDFEQELETHLAMSIEDQIRLGMTPEEARRVALIHLGGVQPTRERYQDAGRVPAVETALQDLRYAFRGLRRDPAFATFAIFILGLGVGASVALFGFVDAALIKPLPYKEPSRLVALFESTQLGPRFHLSYLDYLDWKRFNTSFRSLEAYERHAFMVSTAEGLQDADGARVSAGFFRTLGVAPVFGRDFRAGEDLPASPRTVMLTYAAWQNRFGGRDDVLGQTVTLDGAPNTIVGVLPRGFHFAPAEPAEFWTVLHAGCADDRGCHDLFAVGRLEDGVSVHAALADLTSIAHQLELQYPGSNRNRSATAMPLTDLVVGDIRPILLVLLCGAGLLLVIAAVNVASLLLVRSEGRKREIAVREALGASRARLLRQFATEAFVLVTCSSAFGLVAAYAGMGVLIKLIPTAKLAGMPYLEGLGLNVRVLAFAVVISLITALLFSLVPAMRVARSDMREGLVAGGRGSSRGTRRFNAYLVAIELATAMVLLVSAGLLGESVYGLLRRDLGLAPDHLATLRVAGQRSGNMKAEQVIAMQRQIADRISSLPGVASVGLANRLPVGPGGGTTSIRVVGRPASVEAFEVNDRQISSGYFTTVQARLIRGRFFADADEALRTRVVIINQVMARQVFPAEDPIGKQVFYDGSPELAMWVIGVVNDIREGPLDVATRPALYVPLTQEPTNRFYVIARTSNAEQSLLPIMAEAIHQIDPGMATSEAVTMRDRIRDSPSVYFLRSSTWLVGGFAAAAWLLAVVGLYGVVAYSVSQRRREIAVRLALGAQPGSVYRLIVGNAARLTSAGVAGGILCSVGAATLLQGMLGGIGALDGLTLGGVSLLLAVSALLASCIPARRAVSLGVIEALRTD